MDISMFKKFFLICGFIFIFLFIFSFFETSKQEFTSKRLYMSGDEILISDVMSGYNCEENKNNIANCKDKIKIFIECKDDFPQNEFWREPYASKEVAKNRINSFCKFLPIWISNYEFFNIVNDLNLVDSETYKVYFYPLYRDNSKIFGFYGFNIRVFKNNVENKEIKGIYWQDSEGDSISPSYSIIRELTSIFERKF
jgi:hypothetical protein